MTRSWLLACLVFIAAPACSSTSAFVRSALGTTLVRTELVFGTRHAGQVVVGPEQWQAFLAEVVTPRFPSGFTSFAAHGQWTGQHGLEKEDSYVLLVYHPGTAAEERALEEIRTLYRQRFQQESVMRATSEAKVAF